MSITRGRVKKLELLARGLCIFFHTSGQSSLSLRNEGIEIYDQPGLVLNPLSGLPTRKARHSARPKCPEKTRLKQKLTALIQSRSEKTEEDKRNKAGGGGGRKSRPGVSLSVRNESSSDLKPSKKGLVTVDDSAVNKNNVVNRQRPLKRNVKSLPRFEPYANSNREHLPMRIYPTPTTATGARMGVGQKTDGLCVAGKSMVRQSMLPRSSTSAKLHPSRLNRSIDSAGCSYYPPLPDSRRSLGGGGFISSTSSSSSFSSAKKPPQKSPYTSMWNIRILENFYDVKWSNTSGSASRKSPGFKIRRISNPSPWKTQHAGHRSSVSLIKSHQSTAETTQNHPQRRAKDSSRMEYSDNKHSQKTHNLSAKALVRTKSVAKTRDYSSIQYENSSGPGAMIFRTQENSIGLRKGQRILHNVWEVEDENSISGNLSYLDA